MTNTTTIIAGEHARIEQTLSSCGYGRLRAIVPTGDPSAHYWLTESCNMAGEPYFYVGRAFVGELTSNDPDWTGATR